MDECGGIADVVCYCLAGIVEHIGQDDFRSFSCEDASFCLALASGRSCDDGDFAF